MIDGGVEESVNQPPRLVVVVVWWVGDFFFVLLGGRLGREYASSAAEEERIGQVGVILPCGLHDGINDSREGCRRRPPAEDHGCPGV